MGYSSQSHAKLSLLTFNFREILAWSEAGPKCLELSGFKYDTARKLFLP